MGWAGLGIEVVCGQMMWPPRRAPLYLSQRSLFTHATTTLHFSFLRKRGREVETCSRLRQLRKETPD